MGKRVDGRGGVFYFSSINFTSVEWHLSTFFLNIHCHTQTERHRVCARHLFYSILYDEDSAEPT